MRAVKDSLAAPLRTKWESQKTLARANGTSRRASGWAGENTARSGELIRAIINKTIITSKLGRAIFGHLLRSSLGESASQGEESVLAGSGREGEITARVGRVRRLAFLSILRKCFTVVPPMRTIEVLACPQSFSAVCYV